MELSEQTMQVLKNYASINGNIVISEGNQVKTISEAKNVLSSASLDVEFPQTFGIYDLNEFLSVLSLVDTPRLKFDTHFVTVSDTVGRSRVKYFYSDIESLTQPSRDVIMPEPEVSFVLSRETLSRIRRAASVLGHTELSVSGKDGIISLSVTDNEDSTSNGFSIDVDGEYESGDFNYVLNISNLKMVDGDYNVGLSSKLISHFVNTETSIEYWVALEKTSKVGV
jgi:hypothetical protein